MKHAVTTILLALPAAVGCADPPSAGGIQPLPSGAAPTLRQGGSVD